MLQVSAPVQRHAWLLQATMTVLTLLVCFIPLADRTYYIACKVQCKTKSPSPCFKSWENDKCTVQTYYLSLFILSVLYLRFNIMFTCTERHSWGKIAHSSCDPSYPFWNLHMCTLQGKKLSPESIPVQVPWGTQSDLPLCFMCLLPEPC